MLSVRSQTNMLSLVNHQVLQMCYKIYKIEICEKLRLMIIIYVYYSSDMREFSLSDAIELSEYSYFNPMFLSTWAGPHHWKLKPHSSHDTIEG